MPIVSRRARLFDIAALICIVGGAAMCLVSNAQMKEIAKLSYQHPGPPSISALAAADRARYLAYAGLAVIGAGCVVGVASVIMSARAKRHTY